MLCENHWHSICFSYCMLSDYMVFDVLMSHTISATGPYHSYRHHRERKKHFKTIPRHKTSHTHTQRCASGHAFPTQTHRSGLYRHRRCWGCGQSWAREIAQNFKSVKHAKPSLSSLVVGGKWGSGKAWRIESVNERRGI